jgi:hypothetical protein
MIAALLTTNMASDLTRSIGKKKGNEASLVANDICAPAATDEQFPPSDLPTFPVTML